MTAMEIFSLMNSSFILILVFFSVNLFNFSLFVHFSLQILISFWLFIYLFISFRHRKFVHSIFISNFPTNFFFYLPLIFFRDDKFFLNFFLWFTNVFKYHKDFPPSKKKKVVIKTNRFSQWNWNPLPIPWSKIKTCDEKSLKFEFEKKLF